MTTAAPARDLYQSPWFRKARAYAERVGDAWFILSAKHHLLDPAEVIEPYETTLNTMSWAERRGWTNIVAEQCRGVLRRTDHVVVLAGTAYRKYLVPDLLPFVGDISVPMVGLGIGRQLAWLAAGSTEKRTDGP